LRNGFLTIYLEGVEPWWEPMRIMIVIERRLEAARLLEGLFVVITIKERNCL